MNIQKCPLLKFSHVCDIVLNLLWLPGGQFPPQAVVLQGVCCVQGSIPPAAASQLRAAQLTLTEKQTWKLLFEAVAQLGFTPLLHAGWSKAFRREENRKRSRPSPPQIGAGDQSFPWGNIIIRDKLRHILPASLAHRTVFVLHNRTLD